MLTIDPLENEAEGFNVHAIYVSFFLSAPNPPTLSPEGVIMTSDSRSPAAVYDILHCVISHLDPDRYPNPSDPEGWSVRQALARLATTHTTFTQPALSALWRSLPNDRALKHLLCVVRLAALEDPPKYRGVCPGLVHYSNFLCGFL